VKRAKRKKGDGTLTHGRRTRRDARAKISEGNRKGERVKERERENSDKGRKGERAGTGKRVSGQK